MCPTSGRTLEMGKRPLFRFNCGRRSGFLIRALAPHQAKPGILSGGVSSIQDPPVAGFTCPDPNPHLARHSLAALEIRSPPDRSRLTGCIMPPRHRAWAPCGRCCVNRRSFHSDTKTLRPKNRRVNTKPSRKFFVTLERLQATCQGTWRPIPISTESLIRSAVRATPSLDLIAVAVLATVL